tara:strand:+ start:350 stop:1006 length:657 start_codon:yes stop_codon:yes gene_type:complete
MLKLSVKPIKGWETHDWLIKKHYAKRVPSISHSFGLFEGSTLTGVVTFGSPPSYSLTIGICGEDHSHKVLELNRLCLEHNRKNEASFLVGNALKQLPKPSIVVSYADTSVNHVGYIYQATNFIYTGMSAKRTEWREIGSNKHSKTLCGQVSLEERISKPDKYEIVERPQKHRYVYFCGDKRQKKKLLSLLNYPVKSYPKGNSKRYDSGSQVKSQLVLF